MLQHTLKIGIRSENFLVAKASKNGVLSFVVDYISAYKSQMAFMGLDFKADRPRMKAELNVMMAEL